jgi:hypothetical protein
MNNKKTNGQQEICMEDSKKPENGTEKDIRDQKEQPNSGEKNIRLRFYNYQYWVGLIGVLFIGLVLVFISHSNYGSSVILKSQILSELLSQLGIATIVAAITYVAYQKIVKSKTEDLVVDTTKDIKAKIDRDTEELSDHIKEINKGSLILQGASAPEVGIVAIYKDRHQGLKDVYREINENNEVSLMGIGLRDFFTTSKKGRKDTSKFDFSIEKYLDKGKNNLEVLLLNPYSDYAQIRAAKENGIVAFDNFEDFKSATLYSSVDRTLKFIDKRRRCEIKKEKNDKWEKNNIDVKLYKSINPIFMVITKEYVYVEHYHLGMDKGVGGGTSPLLKMDRKSKLANNYVNHFKHIFDNQSQSVKEVFEEGIYGVDYNIKSSQLINLFMKGICPTFIKRISFLLRASNQIDICGVSLRDFLHPYGNLDELLIKEIRDKKKDKAKKNIRILLLDPFSPAGQLRSRREELIDEIDNEVVVRGELYHDVCRSLQNFDRITRRYSSFLNIEIKLYNLAPTSFLFLTENSVICRQYHYGVKELEKFRGTSFEKDTVFRENPIPLFEYKNRVMKKDIEKEEDKESVYSAYEEFKDHFEFIWNTENLTIDKEEWAKKYFVNVNHRSFEKV